MINTNNKTLSYKEQLLHEFFIEVYFVNKLNSDTHQLFADELSIAGLITNESRWKARSVAKYMCYYIIFYGISAAVTELERIDNGGDF